jgi:hypothetical protein
LKPLLLAEPIGSACLDLCKEPVLWRKRFCWEQCDLIGRLGNCFLCAIQLENFISFLATFSNTNLYTMFDVFDKYDLGSILGDFSHKSGHPVL